MLIAGLRQAMATAGALLGASVAGLAYKLSGQSYTVTFALATIPATLALLLTISVRNLPLHSATSADFSQYICASVDCCSLSVVAHAGSYNGGWLQAFGDSAKAAGAAKKAAKGGPCSAFRSPSQICRRARTDISIERLKSLSMALSEGGWVL